MTRLVLLITLAACALLSALPAAASASRGQEATFQDDNRLIYATDADRAATLDTLQALGADRLRLTVLWSAVAPDPASRTRPDFDAGNPDAYAKGIWHNYDAAIKGALARGMKVNLDVTGPAPLWATQAPPREDIADTFEPSPAEFHSFVVAVGRRYSGTWADPDGGTLPRVGYWSIWNEPNVSGWLTPTWQRAGSGWFARSASLYRELLDAAYTALDGSGHGGDTVLFGETAPAGSNSKNVKRAMTPMAFVRALYCVDRKLRRLKGTGATRLDCGSSPRAFRKAHPALFHATGYAHHPYQLLLPPGVKPRNRDHVTIGVLGRLTSALDRIQRRYGSHRKLPLYLTEFGYQTPPDPYGVPLRYQGSFLNHAEHIASRNRRVRTLSQFLLDDDGEPIRKTFQSGLRTNAGIDKPALAAYRMPFWLRGKGHRRKIWGLLRPAAPGTHERALIQFRRDGSKRWRTIRTVTAKGRRNVYTATLRLRRDGALRVAWGPYRSRTEPVF